MIELSKEEMQEVLYLMNLLQDAEDRCRHIGFPDVKIYDIDGTTLGVLGSGDDNVWAFKAGDDNA